MEAENPTDENVGLAEFAERLDVSASSLARWLRKQHLVGNKALSARQPGTPWRFGQDDVSTLAAQFALSAGQASSSAVQLRADAAIRDQLSADLGLVFEADVVTGRQGPLLAGQKKKVAVNALKLMTIQRERPGLRLYLAFADETACAYAKGKGWVAQALRTWNIEARVVSISAQLRKEIAAAQETQHMVNAPHATEG